MAKLYTFDNKLLIGSPELRIGDSVFPIDDRKSTVKKALKIFGKNKKGDPSDDFDNAEEVLKLAFGKRYKEIEEMDMSFAAYLNLVDIVISAMTGADPDPPGLRRWWPPSRPGYNTSQSRVFPAQYS